ncbi:MAG: DNA/RNA non-specific endonuclease, partial [Syntrophorhabdus sp.]|nr:DNA/RNA non-specific endonuclease [Syntrophorhabdus sp.]
MINIGASNFTTSWTHRQSHSYQEASMRLAGQQVLRALSIFFLFSSLALAGPLEDCAEYARLGVPGQDGDLLCRTGHLLAHDPVRKTPIWVAERLTADKATSTVVPREAGSFRIDSGLKKGRRAGLSDYRKSGYDRGHMASAADMHWDKKAMIECFYLSNMVPQVGKKMNQGIWKALEELVRSWVIDRGEIFIYTGPIYDGGTTKTIGKNKVAIPSRLYKIVYDRNRQEAIAFIMPNKALETEDLPLYIVTVRDVEG